MCSKKNSGTVRLGLNTHEVPLKLFALNRERLITELKKNPRTPPKSVVLLQGGDNIPQYDTDVDYTFRQESFLMWTFGVTEPGVYGSIDVETGKSVLFVVRFPADYEIWMGKLKTLEEFKNKYAVDEVFYVDEIADILKKSNTGVLLTLKGQNSDSGLEVKGAEFKGIEDFKINTEVLYPTMAELRVFKTDFEKDVIRYVVKISSDAHKQVMRFAKPGCSEYQCESVFLDHCYREGGCRYVSYTCICGSGTNGAILHYGHAAAPNDRNMIDGDMCLFDMGANYYGYAADITCSFPVNGKFTEDQKLIYNAVLAANQVVHNAAKPGVSWVDMHRLAGRSLLESLKEGGLLKGDIEDMMAVNLFATFQPHGLGHLIGLDVHDVGGYLPDQPPKPTEPGVNKLRMARILQPRMYVTIEPGCYFIKSLIDQARNDLKLKDFLVDDVIDRFMNFGGIRIEDDVFVTETGVEDVTKVPRTVEEIEKWIAGSDS